MSVGELLEELERLADELGKSPTIRDLDTRGRYSRSAYLQEFGSWKAALDAAGIPPIQRSTISKADLTAELQRLGEELGETPTARDMREQGAYSRQEYISQFGSWNAALEAAGLESREPMTEIPDVELLAELHRLAVEHNRRPSVRLMNEAGAYWDSTYKDHFGSSTNALEAAGFRVEDTTAGLIDQETLLNEILRLTDELGHEPTLSELEEAGRYSPSTYYRRFGSWSAALEEANSSN